MEKHLPNCCRVFRFMEEHSLTEGMAVFAPIYKLLDKLPAVRNISNKIIVLEKELRRCHSLKTPANRGSRREAHGGHDEPRSQSCGPVGTSIFEILRRTPRRWTAVAAVGRT